MSKTFQSFLIDNNFNKLLFKNKSKILILPKLQPLTKIKIFRPKISQKYDHKPEAYLTPCQTSKIEHFKQNLPKDQSYIFYELLNTPL